MQYYTDDGTLTPDHPTSSWLDLLLGAARSIGRTPSPGPSLKKWVEDAGFTNVRERVFKMPIGPWPRNRWLKDLGLANAVQVLDGLEGFSMRLLCDVAGWKEEEVKVLVAHVRRELKGGGLHVYVN